MHEVTFVVSIGAVIYVNGFFGRYIYENKFLEILEKNHKSVRMESGLEGSCFLLPGVDNAAFRGI